LCGGGEIWFRRCFLGSTIAVNVSVHVLLLISLFINKKIETKLDFFLGGGGEIWFRRCFLGSTIAVNVSVHVLLLISLFINKKIETKLDFFLGGGGEIWFRRCFLGSSLAASLVFKTNALVHYATPPIYKLRRMPESNRRSRSFADSRVSTSPMRLNSLILYLI
jgi:hypothetical protein